MPDAPVARVVIDSNVWISALVFGGAPRRVLETSTRDGMRIIASAEIFTEIRRVVATKFPDFSDDVEALLAVLHEQIDVVMLGSMTIEACRDPDDNRVLETAVLGGATAIVSGDKDLLSLGEFGGIAILPPADWLGAVGIRG
jgi:putative PIN family toxin of toxin-antitoxin system